MYTIQEFTEIYSYGYTRKIKVLLYKGNRIYSIYRDIVLDIKGAFNIPKYIHRYEYAV